MTTYHPKTELSGGYSGLKHTAKQIAEYLPNSKIYVEPFAGLGRVGKYSKSKIKIFNDMSDYAIHELRKIFPSSIIIQMDFEECIRLHDSLDTFFLIDPPWRKPIYDNDKSFIDRTPKEYYEKIMDILPTLKGDWFLCSSLAERGLNKILSKSGYPMIDIKGTWMICGKPVTLKMISNKPFIRSIEHQQISITVTMESCGK